MFLPDFVARWSAGRMVLAGQLTDLYNPETQFALQQAELGSVQLSWFVSPPFVALLFVPLAYLPYPVAAIIWLLANMTILLLALGTIRQFISINDQWWRRFMLLTVASAPSIELIGSGQDTAWVLAGFVLGVSCLCRGQQIRAGIWFAVVLIKPHFAVLVPLVLLLHRQWRAFMSMLSAGLVALTASWWLVGVGGIIDFLGVPFGELYTAAVRQGQISKSLALPSLLGGLAPPDIAAVVHTVAAIVGFVVAFGMVAHTRRLRSDSALIMATVLVTIVMTSPHTMVYDAVLLAPVFAIVISRLGGRRSRLMLLGAYLLLLFNPILSVLSMGWPWPGTVLGLGWAAVPIGWFWLQILHLEPVQEWELR